MAVTDLGDGPSDAAADLPAAMDANDDLPSDGVEATLGRLYDANAVSIARALSGLTTRCDLPGV